MLFLLISREVNSIEVERILELKPWTSYPYHQALNYRRKREFLRKADPLCGNLEGSINIAWRLDEAAVGASSFGRFGWLVTLISRTLRTRIEDLTRCGYNLLGRLPSDVARRISPLLSYESGGTIEFVADVNVMRIATDTFYLSPSHIQTGYSLCRNLQPPFLHKVSPLLPNADFHGDVEEYRGTVSL